MADHPSRQAPFLLLHPDTSVVRCTPVVVLLIVAACFSIFAVVAVATLTVGTDLPVQWFAALGLMPASVRWHTPFTYWLLHEHLWHLSLNMLLLLAFGSSVEASYGWKLFGLLFITGAALTGVAQAAASAFAPTGETEAMIIGASGGVATVLGAFASRFHRSRVRLAGSRLSVPVLPFIAALAMAEVFAVGTRSATTGHGAPTPANWAHILGFLYGIVWDQADQVIGRRHSRKPSIPLPKYSEAPEPEGCRTAEEWEAVLQVDRGNEQALVGLPLALSQEGEADRAQACAAWAVLEALERRDGPAAANRYARLKALHPEFALPERSVMELAGMLAELRDFESAAALYLHLASKARDPGTRTAASIRGAACLARNLGRAEEAVAILRNLLETEIEPEWKRYALKLLNEIEARGVS